MIELGERKSLTVKLETELLNRFNAAVKRQGLKNQFVVEQLVTEYVEKAEHIGNGN
jgi:metal-responsive CopG/Arc/MetJ family transcriptional regulator